MEDWFVMGFSIVTYWLFEELAKRTGESMTAAVDSRTLDRIRSEQGACPVDGCCGSAWTARRLKEPYRSASHDAFLYDDRGLPR